MKKAKKKRGIYEKIGQYMATASNKSNNNNYDEYRIYENSRSLRNLCMESSSDEGLEFTGPVAARQRTGRSDRGKSLDYGQIDDKKRLSWFHRESRSTEHTLSRPLKEQKRKHHTLDRTEKYVIEHLRNKLQNPARGYSAYSGSQEWDPRENRHQFESDVYARTEERKRHLSSGRSADDLLSVHEGTKSKKSGKLQIGRRFLRGEIGIKSFNYYLIKEGLKSTTTPNANAEKGPFKSQDPQIKGDEKNSNDQQRKYKEFPSSSSGEGYKGRKTSRAGGAVEENIYEEIFFRDRDLRKGDAKATAKHHRHSHSAAVVTGGSMGRTAARRGETGGESSWKFRDDCEICTQQEQQCANANCEICNANCGLRKRSDSNTKSSKSSNPKARLTLDFNTDMDGDGDEDTDAVYARIRRGGGGAAERGGIFVNKYAETGSHYSRIVPRQDVVMDVDLEHDDDDDDGEVNKALPYVPAQQPVLQFQSYNPNNPGVFKIETTPIAVSNYNPFDAKMCVDSSNTATTSNVQSIYQEIRHINAVRGKSSSSSDSLTHSRNMSRRTGESLKQDLAAEEIYSKPRQRRTNAVIYKTASEASMLSEEARGGGRPQVRMAGEMSDSSIGDSLFSCSNQRRYFGSSESCRLGSDCQRCLERCNYYSEDNKNYCCDCSSSYFSSDFDEHPNGGAFNRNMSSRVSVQSNPATATGVPRPHQQPNQHHQQYDNYYDYPKKAKKSSAKCEPGYGEEFMRHVIHVKNTTSFGEDDSHYSKPKSNTPREMGSSGGGDSGGGSLRTTSSSTTKAMLATEQAEIRNRDSAARKDGKKNVKKKYYYDDIMTIPNEVAYNLSYGMIRRENKARDVPEREKAEAEDQSQPAFVRDDGFGIYEEIKERNPEPPTTTTAISRTKQRDEPNYAAVATSRSRPIDVKETGAKPKVISAPSGHNGDDNKIPTMHIMKKSQPIYASPVKVKRIPAAEKRPLDEVALQLAKPNTERHTTIEAGRTLSGSRPSEQREKSNFDTSLKEEDVYVAIHSIVELKPVGQTNRKPGQNQATEWKTEKCQLNSNLADEEINPNGTEDDKKRSSPSSMCSAVDDLKCLVSSIPGFC